VGAGDPNGGDIGYPQRGGYEEEKKESDGREEEMARRDDDDDVERKANRMRNRKRGRNR